MKIYGATGAFDIAPVEAANPAIFPEQLLRNVAVAHCVAGRERAAVVALVRDVNAGSIEAWADDYLADDSVFTGSATWEQLLGADRNAGRACGPA